MNDMTNYLSDEIAKANQNNNGDLHQLRNIALRNTNIEQQKGLASKDGHIAELQSRINDLEEDNAKLKEENKKLKKQLSIAEDDNEEVQNYERLLCKPMAEIAAVNGNFKETYEKQMNIMAEWMVSQKAFKELAIQFGFDKGLNHNDVIEMGNNKRLDVLDNKNNQEHNTNIEGSAIVTPERAQRLKEKINK